MGKSSKAKDADKPDDNDLVDVVESVISNSTDKSSKPIEEGSEQSSEELLATSAKMVVQTCMDIRRGENVLIVCDPTTGAIGQALHEAVTERSERVLLIVMPKGRHHGEEFNASTTSYSRTYKVFLDPH
jgi:hypothetical protein